MFENEVNWNGTFPEEEHKKLFDYIKQYGGIDIKTAMDMFGTGDMTAKGILTELVEQGYLNYTMKKTGGRSKFWYVFPAQ